MKKYLCAALLLASCESSSDSAKANLPVSQTEKDCLAISAHVKKALDDSTTYQPVEFKAQGNFSRTDSVMLRSALLGKSDSLAEPSKPDMTPAGRLYLHKYRERTKSGKMEVTSKNFVVYPNGEVLSYQF